MARPKKGKISLGTGEASDVREGGGSSAGTQTLYRGLEIINSVSRTTLRLPELAQSVGLTRGTTHRLASTLVRHRYLNFSRGVGYSLGPRLMELGYLAGRQTSLPRAARDYLELLAAQTGDTVHLGVLDGARALYLDKIAGNRRVEIGSRIGERQPVRSTGLGKALVLDANEVQWREYYDYEARLGFNYSVGIDLWLKRMRDYARSGYAFDLEENEDRIRCVAAPIRDITGLIVGAISVSSAAQYMDDDRMRRLVVDVKTAADSVSRELGYTPETRDSEADVAPKKKKSASK